MPKNRIKTLIFSLVEKYTSDNLLLCLYSVQVGLSGSGEVSRLSKRFFAVAGGALDYAA